MKKFKIAIRIMFFVTLFWILETVFFAFNLEVGTEAEKICDNIVKIGYWLSFVILMIPIMELLKYQIFKMEAEINFFKKMVIDKESEEILEKLNTDFIDSRFWVNTEEYKGYAFLKKVEKDEKLGFLVTVSNSMSKNLQDYKEFKVSLNSIKYSPTSWN